MLLTMYQVLINFLDPLVIKMYSTQLLANILIRLSDQ